MSIILYESKGSTASTRLLTHACCAFSLRVARTVGSSTSMPDGGAVVGPFSVDECFGLVVDSVQAYGIYFCHSWLILVSFVSPIGLNRNVAWKLGFA
jgi:hypothetical protein